MPRRLFACLVPIFLLAIFCTLALAQGDFPALPAPGAGGGYGDAPAIPPPPPPPPSDDGGFTQPNQGGNPTGNNSGSMMPGQVAPIYGDTNLGDVTSPQPPKKDPLDNGPSPGLSTDPTVSTFDNWSVFGRDSSHSCYVPEKFTYPLKLNWKYVTKVPVQNPTSPVIADGIMYFVLGGRLYAMNAETGVLYWKYPELVPLPAGISQPPVVGDDLVYIGSADGNVHAVRKSDGKYAWGFLAKGAVTSPPLLYGGVLYIGSSDRRFYSINAQTGNPIWKGGFVTGDAVIGAPIVAAGQVYFLSSDMNLYCVAPSGKYRCIKVGYPTKVSGPVFGDNMIFLSTGGMIQAFQAQTLYQQWSFSLPATLATTPVYANGSLYFACEDHMLYAVNRDGKAKWKKPVDLSVSATGIPVIAGDTLIIGGAEGRINAIDCATGDIKWTYDVKPSQLGRGHLDYVNLRAPMVVYKGALYAFADDGTILSFRSDIADTTAPIITPVAPARDSTLPATGTIVLAALVSDELSGLDWRTAFLSFDGNIVDAKIKEQNGLIYFKRKPKNNVGGLVDTLADGRHVVKLEICDWAGNKAQMEWSFNVDGRLIVAPDVEVGAPKLPGSQEQPGVGGRGFGGGGGRGGPGGMMGGMMGGGRGGR